jgi:hypothetical protein
MEYGTNLETSVGDEPDTHHSHLLRLYHANHKGKRPQHPIRRVL